MFIKYLKHINPINLNNHLKFKIVHFINVNYFVKMLNKILQNRENLYNVLFLTKGVRLENVMDHGKKTTTGKSKFLYLIRY